jgi:hypothetical protein
VRVSAQRDTLTTFDSVYKIEKGALYNLEVQLEPYWGSFTRETADKTLSEFKIPNYLRETLVANTMIIRAR